MDTNGSDLMSCLFSAGMQFSCEVWDEVSLQDPDPGQFIRVWEKLTTTKCDISLIPTTSRRSPVQEMYVKKSFSYENYLYITIPISIKETSRITNIQTKLGESLFQEITGLPTIFEVLGKEPAIDGGFGKILGYTIFCNRSEVQEMSNEV